MMIITTMYSLLVHHFMMILNPVFSMVCHHGDKHVLEEPYCNHMYGPMMM